MITSTTNSSIVGTRFAGCVCGQVLASVRAYRTAEKKSWAQVSQGKEIELPMRAHEIYHGTITAQHYIEREGKLNLLSLGLGLLGPGWDSSEAGNR